MTERVTLERIIGESGRLAHEDSALIARALLLILKNRTAWPDDHEEALVQAVATLRVSEDRKATGKC